MFEPLTILPRRDPSRHALLPMKHLIASLIAGLATVAFANTAAAQVQLTGHGFTDSGAFRLMLSGSADVETSQDLQSWSHYASVTQPTGLDDLATRQMDHRFYRLRGSSNVLGYLKATIPAGKLALLGNSFGTAIRFDTPESRLALFGSTNPAVKVSVYTNGNFVAHTFDPASGSWSPQIRPIRPQEGFAVQNTGSVPINVRMSGPVRMDRVQRTVPAGGAAIASAYPHVGPANQLRDVAAPDGAQVLWFDEQKQAYQTSTFDTLEKPGHWEPKLADVPVGRAVIVKTAQPLSFTNTFQAAPSR
jgi:hypothetical protein